jgi:SET domain-containing protein
MNKLRVKKSRINGNGLFAGKNFKKGEIIGYIHGPKIVVREWTPKLSRISENWIGASKYTWIITDDSPFKYINHSCEPNVAIKGQRTVYALENIMTEEEIVMDYSLTETDENWSIKNCTCGSIHCRKKIGPITSLSEEQFKRSKKIIPTRFIKAYTNK